MIINNIHLKNFKGIEDLDIKFDNRFTILIGDNATGKTSILDGVSIGIGTILMKTGASFGYSGTKTRPLFKDEIRKVIVSPDNIEYTNVELSGVFIYEGESLKWHRKQSVFAKSLSYKDSNNLTSLGKQFVEQIQEPLDLPLFIHHSTARLWDKIKKKNQKTGSRLEGYYACLDTRSIKDIFFHWFRKFEDNVLKFDKDKSLYDAFTSAITSVVPQWSKIHFNWDLEDLVGLTPEGNWLPLKNLSDGYRNIIHLTADIAYRAIKLNPHLGQSAVIETKGIVLIDEIDMHLHPKWQRRIVNDLKETFPKIQFIVTTHSPFIIQSSNDNEVINLDNNQHLSKPFTKSIEEIAEHEMNVKNVTRSKKFIRYQKTASKYFELIKKGKNSINCETTYDLKKELDNLELEFNEDPIYTALMIAERKTNLK